MRDGRFLVWDFDGTLATRPGQWSAASHPEAQHQCEMLTGVAPIVEQP